MSQEDVDLIGLFTDPEQEQTTPLPFPGRDKPQSRGKGSPKRIPISNPSQTKRPTKQKGSSKKNRGIKRLKLK